MTSSVDVYSKPNEYLRNTGDTFEARGMSDHPEEMEMKSKKPFLGYYEFLITEGSYKFWVVFQLFTVAVLVYSAFAALYYAKYTYSQVDYSDYGDYFLKRSARSTFEDSTFLGLPVSTYLKILESITDHQRYK